MTEQQRLNRNAYARKWRARRTDEQRAKHRAYFRKVARKKYGIIDATDEIKYGACPICGVDKPRPLHYDHDHSTGLFRGWICHWCNSKLGWYEKYREAIGAYLKED